MALLLNRYLGFVGSGFLQRWDSGRFTAVMLGIREYVLRGDLEGCVASLGRES